MKKNKNDYKLSTKPYDHKHCYNFLNTPWALAYNQIKSEHSM
jgi:hypothetical protein